LRSSFLLVSKSGPVAQLGARFHGMEEVVGSIPTRSTKSPNNLDGANACSDGVGVALRLASVGTAIGTIVESDLPRP
jgi:hypothetical protein